ncbi:MAG: membrane dipeptidase, partial [Chloroflexi bacterium]|nr:membrane dipeptidase [Chloroflexota bacterium]
EAQKAELERKLVKANFLPDLRRHEHARNLTRRLIERGYRDGEIEKILYGNWMRVFQSVLGGRATRA